MSPWSSLNGTLKRQSCRRRHADGRLSVPRGTDNSLWHIGSLVRAVTGRMASLGGQVLGDPGRGLNLATLELFVWGSDRALWHNWQTSPTGNGRAGLAVRWKLTADPSAAANGDGPAGSLCPRTRQRPVAHLADRPQQRMVELGVARRDRNKRLRGRRQRRRPAGSVRRAPIVALAQLAEQSGGEWSGWNAGGGGLAAGSRWPQHRRRTSKYSCGEPTLHYGTTGSTLALVRMVVLGGQFQANIVVGHNNSGRPVVSFAGLTMRCGKLEKMRE